MRIMMLAQHLYHESLKIKSFHCYFFIRYLGKRRRKKKNLTKDLEPMCVSFPCKRRSVADL